MRFIGLSLAAAMLLGGCNGGTAAPDNAATARADGKAEVTIVTGSGERHQFVVDVADTFAKQQQGLMYRTSIPANGGMLFAPYPPDGGAPKVASFWMRNTPSALDILFIRPDGTIASIGEDTIPFSETPVGSGEPVGAVLEINGGKSAELGIAPGDKVTW